MLESSRARINSELPSDALVLDIGGWASPLARADWVLDLMPYETRGLYGEPDPEEERFSAATWVTRDICDRTSWPFRDDQFDFAVCSHTLEDVRDPIWVCSELVRVARAGYVEVPARSQEQSKGVHGPWVGWSHHHWLIDIHQNAMEFVFKPHLLHGHPEFWVAPDWIAAQPPDRLVNTLFWDGSFAFRERLFYQPEELHQYLAGVGEVYGAPMAGNALPERSSGLGRVARILKRPG